MLDDFNTPNTAVLIPSSSGLSYYEQSIRRQNSRVCLNPFFIRSQLLHKESAMSILHANVLIPSSSGLSYYGKLDIIGNYLES